jgi:isoquinoline 1-oxidoreductase alpha subunit
VATSISFSVNGKPATVSVDDTNMPLLWVLRDLLGLTGTKYGCGQELCGACTVMVNGQREHSCVFNVGSAAGATIITVEGLAADADGQKAQKAWVDNQVPQCGFCQPGMLMATVAAMKAGHHGKEILSEVKHICMCGTYQRLSAAMQVL